MENNSNQSRGNWTFNRIGRPDVIYDQRTNYTANVTEFERAINDRTKHGDVDVVYEALIESVEQHME